MRESFDIKDAVIIGPEPGDGKVLNVLNRKIVWSENGDEILVGSRSPTSRHVAGEPEAERGELSDDAR
eukprot:2315538-Heterocapsa_arctica.AAC.1